MWLRSTPAALCGRGRNASLYLQPIMHRPADGLGRLRHTLADTLAPAEATRESMGSSRAASPTADPRLAGTRIDATVALLAGAPEVGRRAAGAALGGAASHANGTGARAGRRIQDGRQGFDQHGNSTSWSSSRRVFPHHTRPSAAYAPTILAGAKREPVGDSSQRAVRIVTPFCGVKNAWRIGSVHKLEKEETQGVRHDPML